MTVVTSNIVPDMAADQAAGATPELALPVARRSEVWRGVHRALADPLRIQLFEALWRGPRSVKELAAEVGLAPDRLYYHLRQLERAGIVEVAEYRRLASGQAERVYRKAEVEPPSDTSSPEELAGFFGSVLDATKADVTAALMAKASGERREVMLSQGVLRLDDRALAELHSMVAKYVRRRERPDEEEGTPVRLTFAFVDLEDRPARSRRGRRPRSSRAGT
jgi:DNA-binding transcriptional ArsR family regulator